MNTNSRWLRFFADFDPGDIAQAIDSLRGTLDKKGKKEIYLARSSDTGICKIGLSGNPKKRCGLLRYKTGDKSLRVVHSFNVRWPLCVEAALVSMFRERNTEGEFFALTERQINWFCTLDNIDGSRLRKLLVAPALDRSSVSNCNGN